MRKLILGEWLSLDGFASDIYGSTKFFEDPKFGSGSDEEMLDFMESIDTILLGRKTYEMFVEYWPQEASEGEIMADRLNATPKVVVSSTIKKAPWGNWPDALVLSGDPVEEIAKLKSQQGKDIVVWGSLSLARTLIRSGLVDEYQIRVVPVILGRGIPLFEKSDPIALKLVKTQSYKSGIAYLRYVPA
ncbi:dihydrofolate reductase family protein [Flavobacterium selenitireducens]|uniref:dihydrofolate reductase family protein n=1 Tax=Flavobacterium selenitireducens TaxID=2722704 RepID=UPI00168AB4CF|nr:dihydrofolate reductase family protein [Flavobacterium selenitireducens]MBD3583048.1 dihydrofolate reductase [Flavobacterium selenitireducens]